MASVYAVNETDRRGFWQALGTDAASIGNGRFDALFLWGAPLVAFALILALSAIATALPVTLGKAMAKGLVAAMTIITYSHLIAVVPRAYLNRDVLGTHKARLTVVPLIVLAALVLSPTALIAGTVLAVFWDVHHSAMQTFGLGRIYDMKAGNDPRALRRIDLLLNAALYIGPAAAGAAMIVHFNSFARFGTVGWQMLATVPAEIAPEALAIRIVAILAWLAVVSIALVAYARAAGEGYRISPHKLALLLSTASVSILAWDFMPPFVAFMIVNLFHAIQYFAIVWLKEGKRMQGLVPSRERHAFPLFLAACGAFGVLYWIAAAAGPLKAGAWLAPFVACSLLHFWFDAFVWSVRKKLV